MNAEFSVRPMAENPGRKLYSRTIRPARSIFRWIRRIRELFSRRCINSFAGPGILKAVARAAEFIVQAMAELRGRKSPDTAYRAACLAELGFLFPARTGIVYTQLLKRLAAAYIVLTMAAIRGN